MTLTDKRARADLFRTRLSQALETSQLSVSALARHVGVDRSTVSQLLRPDGARLPNAHIVAGCASVLGVSVDWLLGLAERPETAIELAAEGLEFEDAPRALVDEAIFRWHQTASGYKIRHVPATLPDMLKTREMLSWEYAPHLGRTAEEAITAASNRLEWMRASPSDYEIVMPMHEIDAFATGTGYYARLNKDIRRAQLDHFAILADQLYPRLRIYLFDARRLFSAPVTVFGPLLAVLYLGQSYLVLRASDRIQRITQNFDLLVREAEIDTRALPRHLERLAARIV